MAVKLRAYANCDDVYLAWTSPAPIANCLGFAIECRRRRNGKVGAVAAISNRVGFAADDPHSGDKRSSREWPFQRYDWTDHAADLGDEIEYRVVARVGTPGNLADGPASAWTGMLALDADCDGIKAYFNRGFVISQFVARILARDKITAAQLKKRAAKYEDPTRRFLSGELRTGLLGLLEEIRKGPGLKAYAALYELADDELIEALVACGDKVEVVLANGSVDAKGDDQNADGRKALADAGIVVHDRMVSPGALGHNKFVVVCRKTAGKEQPFRLWTGSTNWTTTGLCTQVNNAIEIENDDLAKGYLAHWERLKAAGSAKPATLAAANTSPNGPFPLGAGQSATGWLTPVRQQVDLDALKALVAQAQDGILFVMFNAGPEPLRTLLQRQQAGFYVRGVVNQIGPDQKAEIKLIKDKPDAPFFLDIIEPQGVAGPLASWAAEVTRGQFTATVGYAMTHSKMMVIDPFGARPVVVTGSHNFSGAASKTNDDNFVVVEGNRKLAQAYAVNCMMAYQHYRWRQYLQETAARHIKPFEFLETSAKWQSRANSARAKADAGFWVR